MESEEKGAEDSHDTSGIGLVEHSHEHSGIVFAETSLQSSPARKACFYIIQNNS